MTSKFTPIEKAKSNKYQLLINKFHKDPKAVWADVRLIKKEMSIAKKLFNLYSDIFFWINLQLSFKLNSLAWFLRKDGKEILRFEFNKQKILRNKKSKKIQLSETKYGKDVEIQIKPKTTFEFLGYAKNKEID